MITFQDIINKIQEIKDQYAKNGKDHESMALQYNAAVQASEQILGALVEMINNGGAKNLEAQEGAENTPQEQAGE